MHWQQLGGQVVTAPKCGISLMWCVAWHSHICCSEVNVGFFPPSLIQLLKTHLLKRRMSQWDQMEITQNYQRKLTVSLIFSCSINMLFRNLSYLWCRLRMNICHRMWGDLLVKHIREFCRCKSNCETAKHSPTQTLNCSANGLCCCLCGFVLYLHPQ